MSAYQDKVLTCKDTGKTFIFTAREQEFFAKEGWPDPIRCPEARKAKKERHEKRNLHTR